MKPKQFSLAHESENLAEIVCSNSFKSNAVTNACGLLKEELRRLDSLLIYCADKTAVPAGQALAVDRDKFSALVTKEIKKFSSSQACVEADFVGIPVRCRHQSAFDFRYNSNHP